MGRDDGLGDRNGGCREKVAGVGWSGGDDGGC
jgi:hypothetical protein